MTQKDFALVYNMYVNFEEKMINLQNYTEETTEINVWKKDKSFKDIQKIEKKIEQLFGTQTGK